jgi:hypothetical protein
LLNSASVELLVVVRHLAMICADVSDGRHSYMARRAGAQGYSCARHALLNVPVALVSRWLWRILSGGFFFRVRLDLELVALT